MYAVTRFLSLVATLPHGDLRGFRSAEASFVHEAFEEHGLASMRLRESEPFRAVLTRMVHVQAEAYEAFVGAR